MYFIIFLYSLLLYSIFTQENSAVFQKPKSNPIPPFLKILQEFTVILRIKAKYLSFTVLYKMP